MVSLLQSIITDILNYWDSKCLGHPIIGAKYTGTTTELGPYVNEEGAHVYTKP